MPGPWPVIWRSASPGGSARPRARARFRAPTTGTGRWHGPCCYVGMMSSIVVGYDFSHTGHAALRRAVSVASDEAHVLHVLCVLDAHEPLPSIPAEDGVDYRY